MAKGKNINPADAYRKAQRKKELKKNKSGRQKARDFALVKKDTSELEGEIEELEAKSEPSALEKARLKELKAELERILKKKEEYVAENPDKRKLVFKAKKQNSEQSSVPVVKADRKLFKKNGLPRHPERSIYYDLVMNPFGVAPPGRPYIERPLLPGEVDGDQQNEQDSDDDIAMPDEPLPGQADEKVDSDDDIPMPEGPAPGSQPADIMQSPPFPPQWPGHPGALPPFIPQIPVIPPPPPPPLGFPYGSVPPVLAQPAIPQHYPPPPPGLPPLPAGFPIPPAPPGSFPRRNQSSGAMQDPLSNVPHQTYQAHQASRSYPRPPPLSTSPASTNETSAATVSAAPELRDLKKESTAFLPTSLKRKKAAASTKVNSAPSVGASTEETQARPDLVSALKDQFGAVPAKGPTAVAPKPKDDYAKFVEAMGDVLNT